VRAAAQVQDHPGRATADGDASGLSHLTAFHIHYRTTTQAACLQLAACSAD
jgi:hypothetical protein